VFVWQVEDATPVFLSSGGPGQKCPVVSSDNSLLVQLRSEDRGSSLQVKDLIPRLCMWEPDLRCQTKPKSCMRHMHIMH
jgi:hypothetical protein